MVWCGVVWCSVVWCGVVWFGVGWGGMKVVVGSKSVRPNYPFVRPKFKSVRPLFNLRYVFLLRYVKICF